MLNREIRISLYVKKKNDTYVMEQNFDLPYYRKLTLHEIKVLEINAT